LSIAIVLPTRDRHELCRKTIQNCLDKSKADIYIYVDDDDHASQGLRDLESDRVTVVIGPPIGRAGAVNAVCDQFRQYRIYMVMVDDATFERNDWEIEVEMAFDLFPNDIGLVHLESENGMTHVNWPCISRTWIDALGWAQAPTFRRFCTDTVLGCLAEAMDRITYITPQVVHHQALRSDHAAQDAAADVWEFLRYMVQDFNGDLRKLRDAL
jgi:hypothetical protein